VTAGVRGGAAPVPLRFAFVGAAVCLASALLVSGSETSLFDAWTIPEAHAADVGAIAAPASAGARSRADASVSASAASSLAHSRVLPWPIETVWPTAVRYLRVDRGYTIVDRDPEAGFVLFEFKLDRGRAGDDDAPKGSGSLELFATTDAAGRPSAHVEVTVDGGAAHLPFAIVDGLHTKLREERGTPPPPPKPKEPPKRPKKPRGFDPHGPPDDPGLDPTPDPPPDPPQDPEPDPPKGKGKDKAPRIFE
jgi:hypothetical protein